MLPGVTIKTAYRIKCHYSKCKWQMIFCNEQFRTTFSPTRSEQLSDTDACTQASCLIIDVILPFRKGWIKWKFGFTARREKKSEIEDWFKDLDVFFFSLNSMVCMHARTLTSQWPSDKSLWPNYLCGLCKGISCADTFRHYPVKSQSSS